MDLSKVFNKKTAKGAGIGAAVTVAAIILTPLTFGIPLLVVGTAIGGGIAYKNQGPKNG